MDCGYYHNPCFEMKYGQPASDEEDADVLLKGLLQMVAATEEQTCGAPSGDIASTTPDLLKAEESDEFLYLTAKGMLHCKLQLPALDGAEPRYVAPRGSGSCDHAGHRFLRKG